MSLNEKSSEVADAQSMTDVESHGSHVHNSGHSCVLGTNIDSISRCFSNSKWFNTTAESMTLDSRFPTSRSNTYSSDQKYWICTLCRQATTDTKHTFSRVKKNNFYCCDVCWKQTRLQAIFGMIFRQIQFHLGFTTLWIPSPRGAFLGDKSRDHGEWVAIVVLLVITLLFEIASFVNVIAFRGIAKLKRKQQKRPVLDFLLEVNCFFCWFAIITVMVHDGIHQYGHNTWDGRLIALIACGCLTLLSYLFTSIVAWRNLIETNVTVIEGFTDPFGLAPKVEIVKAIAYLS